MYITVHGTNSKQMEGGRYVCIGYPGCLLGTCGAVMYVVSYLYRENLRSQVNLRWYFRPL